MRSISCIGQKFSFLPFTFLTCETLSHNSFALGAYEDLYQLLLCLDSPCNNTVQLCRRNFIQGVFYQQRVATSLFGGLQTVTASELEKIQKLNFVYYQYLAIYHSTF